MLWYSKGRSGNILYILQDFILDFTLDLLFFYYIDDDDEEACDTAVTWHVTW